MKKKLSIALLAFSLAMLLANFLVRRVGKMLPPSQEEIEEAETDFTPFGKSDKTDTIKPGEMSFEKLESYYQPQEEEIVKPLLDEELTEEQKNTVETYVQNPQLEDFIKEISAVIPPEKLEQENYLNIAYNPEVRNIFMKYSQDKNFRTVAETIMKDKNLLQFAEKLINEKNDKEVQK